MDKHIHWACWFTEDELRNAILIQIEKIKKANFQIRNSLEHTKLFVSLEGVGSTVFEISTPMGLIAQSDTMGLAILFAMAGKPNTFAVTESDGRLISNISQQAAIIKKQLSGMDKNDLQRLLVALGLVTPADVFRSRQNPTPSVGIRIEAVKASKTNSTNKNREQLPC